MPIHWSRDDYTMRRRVLASILGIRLLAACSPLHDILQYDQQLTSPLTSYPRCTRCLLPKLVDLTESSRFSTRRGVSFQTWYKSLLGRCIPPGGIPEPQIYHVCIGLMSGQSPILLSLFTTILPLTPSLATFLWTLCDGIGAWSLSRIWRLRNKPTESSREGLVVALYVV